MKKRPPLSDDAIVGSETRHQPKEGSRMHYTGIDLHRKTSFITTFGLRTIHPVQV